ncbi:hypothetical protein IMSAGC011_02294 [Lachnospiraceae bacterium]|nr:hypothetical protein IMSAGC011_02294 [Lachnospiraceae bacterium]
MNTFTIFENNKGVPFFVENDAFEGIKRISVRVASDIKLVTDSAPDILAAPYLCNSDRIVIFATLGRSPFLDALEASSKWSSAQIQGKREVYQLQVVDTPFAEVPSIKEALVIVGSDKRGTIYGMFHLSKLCGVSPLIYWGDVVPQKKDTVILSIENGIVSKEPSVKYRGFFINDEWPAFGNWCTETFGGVNAKAYEEIFILLLRLKGNYLWPAMWNSIFSEEGPGLASAELADIYGIIMGASHHEPMCRAGAEWQRVYQRYGTDNTWSFVSNKEAITAFWKDGILRNKPFENVITIGMRGENDSMLLSADAKLVDNIQVIKDAIVTQHMLLQKHIDENLKNIPRMLAIYKEVEDYYYGDATCAGLKGWKELEDVILLLCEDNFGNTRGLPSKADRNHPGGYGMYYHFDYHGGPISYEWQNTTRLTKTWEQMTQAYEYGVRELWIVNVGDLKGVEYPLCYFMDLAYDYETYSQKNMTESYAKTWVEQQFGSYLDEKDRQDLLVLLDGFTKWNAARRPEAMSPNIYHPCHFREAERVWKEIQELMGIAKRLREHMPKECMAAYGSMIYYPAITSFNLILMHIEAGWNAFYAKQGNLGANAFAASVKQRASKDCQYIQAYHKLANGKWNHMMDSAHTGFHSWDAHNWTYPTVQEVIPLPIAKIIVGFRGGEDYHLGAHWQDSSYPCNDDFTRPDTRDVVIELGSRGEVDFTYCVKCNKPWACFDRIEGTVKSLTNGKESIVVTCDRAKLKGKEHALVEIFVTFTNGEKTVGRLELLAEEIIESAYSVGTYVEKQGYIAMNADGFVEQKDIGEEGFAVIAHLGRMGSAVKAFPVTKSWTDTVNAPYLRYTFAAKNTADYNVRFYLLPRNPVEKGARMCLAFSVNGGQKKIIDTVSNSFHTDCTCEEWNCGVLDNIRIVESVVSVNKGENELYFYAADPGIVLERIVLYPQNTKLPESYLGPIESWKSSRFDGI